MTAYERSYVDRITINPNILAGKPVITGTRIPVYLILNLTAHSYDFDQIFEDYLNLTPGMFRQPVCPQRTSSSASQGRD